MRPSNPALTVAFGPLGTQHAQGEVPGVVDLRSRGRGTGFDVGGGSRPPLLQRRELYIVFILVLLALLALSYIDFSDEPAPARAPAPEELVDRLAPMTLPDLEELAVAPAELGDRDRQDVDYLLAQADEVPQRISGPTPFSLHWLAARLEADRVHRPIYQRLADEDLLRATLPAGIPFLADGLLVDLRSHAGWEWAVVALDADRYVVVAAQAVDDAVVIGEQVRLIGRTAGTVPLAGGRRTSFLGVRTLLPRPEETTPDQDGLGRLPKIGVGGRPPEVDESALWSEIDDVHPVLELRPYYYLLGIVSRVDTYHTDPYEGARDAVDNSIELHDEPSAFRGEPFHIEGRVLYSFEDRQVADDEPYGIERVLRIVLWNEVFGPIGERTLTGEVEVTRKWVRQAFEIAVIGNEPPPPKGALIRATGRFLKVHGVPAEARNTQFERDQVRRHSDNVYFKFFVANSYRDITPQDIDWAPLRWAFLILVPLMLGWVVYLDIRDRRYGRSKPDQIRRLRRTRRQLQLDAARRRAADAAAGAEAQDGGEYGSPPEEESGATPSPDGAEPSGDGPDRNRD